MGVSIFFSYPKGCKCFVNFLSNLIDKTARKFGYEVSYNDWQKKSFITISEDLSENLVKCFSESTFVIHILDFPLKGKFNGRGTLEEMAISRELRRIRKYILHKNENKKIFEKMAKESFKFIDDLFSGIDFIKPHLQERMSHSIEQVITNYLSFKTYIFLKEIKGLENDSNYIQWLREFIDAMFENFLGFRRSLGLQSSEIWAEYEWIDFECDTEGNVTSVTKDIVERIVSDIFDEIKSYRQFQGEILPRNDTNLQNENIGMVVKKIMDKLLTPIDQNRKEKISEILSDSSGGQSWE